MTRPIQPVRRAAWLVSFLFCCLLGGLVLPGAAQADTGTAPVITNIPPAAPVNTSYWFQFDTTGTDPFPQFTLGAGTLPDGLQFANNGVIWGFPTAMGPGSPVIVRASNGIGPDAEITFTIDVVASPPTFTVTPPTTGTVGTEYYGRFYLRGTPTPTTAVTGDLPPGVEFFPEFSELIGTPTTAGDFTFTVTATNGAQPDATSTITITVAAAAQARISGQPPAGAVGQQYSWAFATVGNPTVSFFSGTLPPGLTLAPSGLLSGTPTRAGSYVFTVQGVGVGSPVVWTVGLGISGPPTVSITDAAAREGGRGDLTPMTFRITLDAPSTQRVTVGWSTRNGTAVAGRDYVAAAGSVAFAPGQTEATVTVQVRGDRQHERTECLTVRLSNPAGAGLADGSGVGSIYDND